MLVKEKKTFCQVFKTLSKQLLKLKYYTIVALVRSSSFSVCMTKSIATQKKKIWQRGILQKLTMHMLIFTF
jgi:hypothetical protein